MSLTLCPGSCPPSPGFAPCAILICSTSALMRYSGVTPKRPGGDLLDLGVLLGAVARRVLAALAGVGARAEAVHRRWRALRAPRARARPGTCRRCRSAPAPLRTGSTSASGDRLRPGRSASRSRNVDAGRSLTRLREAPVDARGRRRSPPPAARRSRPGCTCGTRQPCTYLSRPPCSIGSRGFQARAASARLIGLQVVESPRPARGSRCR